MSTDVKLDQDNGNSILLEAGVVKATAADFVLDSSVRHTGRGTHRRALVHDFSDGLTVNFAGDYPGGVTINGNIINLNTLTVDNPNAAGDVQLTFFHPDELDQDGNPRIPGFNETVFVGALLTTLRDEISALKSRVAELEKK
jgi:hypothetical protein